MSITHPTDTVPAREATEAIATPNRSTGATIDQVASPLRDEIGRVIPLRVEHNRWGAAEPDPRVPRATQQWEEFRMGPQ